MPESGRGRGTAEKFLDHNRATGMSRVSEIDCRTRTWTPRVKRPREGSFLSASARYEPRLVFDMTKRGRKMYLHCDTQRRGEEETSVAQREAYRLICRQQRVIGDRNANDRGMIEGGSINYSGSYPFPLLARESPINRHESLVIDLLSM